MILTVPLSGFTEIQGDQAYGKGTASDSRKGYFRFLEMELPRDSRKGYVRLWKWNCRETLRNGSIMRKRTYLKLVEYQTGQARQHLGEVQGIYREMRGYKHDFHHHLQALKGQLEAGEVERAIEYIEQLDSQLMNVDTLLKTGNISLDAILSAKLAQAKEAGIAVTVKANVPDKLLLSDLELSILVGNLLDNAIEACGSAQEPRFIRIFMGMKGRMLYFSMLNSAGGKEKKKGNLFDSHKKGMHGFGLRRVEAILREHDGWCKYNSEDGAFTSEFLVPAVENAAEQPS